MLLIKFPLIIIIVPTNRAKLEPFDKINAGNPHKYRLSAFLSVIQTQSFQVVYSSDRRIHD